ncbi:MAG: hypothetical protein H7836_15955 [Magnetococcus sp. YQC-3]
MPRNNPSGFTLLETLLAMSVATLLTFQIWNHLVKIQERWQWQQWRLQAILVANGEMERLYALYQYATPEPESSPASYYQDGGGVIHPTIDHLVHGPNGAHNNLLAASMAAFRDEAGLHAILRIPGPRNVVWLDREAGHTAQLSWLTQPVNDPVAAPCHGPGGECLLVTLFLDYPYRIGSDDDPLVPIGEAVQTLVLKTIIGKRY